MESGMRATGKLERKKGNGSNKGLAYKQQVTKGQVKDMINGLVSRESELKHFEFSWNIIAVPYTGNIYSLSDIPQGDTDQERDGDALFLKKLELRYTVTQGDANNAFRVIVFRWNSQSTPTLAGVLEDAGGSPYTPHSSFKHDNRQILKILFDKLYQVSSLSGTSVCDSAKLILNQFVQYQSATTVGTNKIYILVVSDSAAATHPTFTGYMAVTYTDS